MEEKVKAMWYKKESTSFPDLEDGESRIPAKGYSSLWELERARKPFSRASRKEHSSADTVTLTYGELN